MNERDFFFYQLKHGNYSIHGDVLIVHDAPGEQMARVDEATLQELVHLTWTVPPSWERSSGACISVAQWPNTDPTLTVFHQKQEETHGDKAE